MAEKQPSQTSNSEDQTSERKHWTDIAQACAAMIVAASALVATSQYYWRAEDNQIAETQKFLERFESDRYTEMRQEIDQLVLNTSASLESEAERFEAAGMGEFSTNIRDRALVAIVMAEGEGKSAEPPRPILEMISFFGGVQVCIEEEICHAETAHAFLDIYAQSFWDQFEPVIGYARKSNRPSLGSRMEEFVDAIER